MEDCYWDRGGFFDRFGLLLTGFSNYRLHKRSNRVRFIPFNKLLEYQQQIHREGGRVASVTPVN